MLQVPERPESSMAGWTVMREKARPNPRHRSGMRPRRPMSRAVRAGSCAKPCMSCRRTRLFQQFPHRRNHFVFVRKLARGQFGVDRFSIGTQLKTPAGGRLQLHALQLLFVTAQNLARQTDGTRLVVSGGTIAQMQLHDLLLVRIVVGAAKFTSPF